MNCYICNNQIIIIEKSNSIYTNEVVCIQCGKYKISKSLVATDALNKIPRHILSARIRKETDNGTTIEIDEYNLYELSGDPEIPLAEKADKLLLAFASSVSEYNEKININSQEYIAKIAAKSNNDYLFCLKLLLEQEFTTAEITLSFNGEQFHDYRISSKGWMKVESLRKQVDSRQGFVAMWFDPSMNSIFDNAIKPAIEKILDDTGNATPQSTGLLAMRIDKKEHIEKIDDQIIAEIQRSRFLVADFTGHRGGVYFEAGYALGKGIPVIWTCRDNYMKDLHFDIRQYNCIEWSNENEFRQKLYHRIRAVIG